MRKFRFFKFLLLIFSLCFCLTSCSGCNQNENSESDPNSIPKFSGMAITEKSPLTDSYTLSNLLKANFLGGNLAQDAEADGDSDDTSTTTEGTTSSENNHDAIEVPEDNMPDIPENADIEENLLPEISVGEGANVTPFYAEVNQDVYVSVSIVNPNSFAILRFTLNGVVYQSYQFETGSTSELLVLKVNSGDTPGIKEYTIDEIKYVSDVDNQIRDAIIAGEQTVKLSVAYDKVPTAAVNNESQDLSSYEASIFVSDPLSLIDFTKQECKLYFYDGETVLLTKALEKGANSFKVDGLVMGKSYQYMVVANYDGLDKAGYSTHVLLKKDVNTSMFIKLSNVSTNFDEISFDYKVINKDANFMDIYLFKDGEAIAKVDDELKFSGLLSDTKYEIRLYFNFVLNGEKFVFYDVFRTKTLAYPVPTLNATFKVYESSVEYNVAVDDDYNLVTLKSIKLYNQSGDFITNGSYDNNVIENLSRNANYFLEFIYTYDLNDGNGLQEAKKVVSFSTTKFVPVVEIRPFAVTEDSIQFDLIVTDPNVVGRVNSLRLYQAQGRSFVSQLNDAVNRTFNNLKPNTKYIVEIGYQYDLDDGRGSQLATFELEVSTAKQLPTFNANITATEDGYEIKSLAEDPDNAGKVKSATVSLNGEAVKEVEGGDLITIDGLLSNKEYVVNVVYEYDLLDLNGPQELSVTKTVKTLEKNKPVIKVTGQDVTYSSFDINLTTFDPSKILTINKLEVKLGTTLVKTFESLDGDLTVDNLYSNNKYEIVIYHEYDLNDGEGDKEYTTSQFISTLKRDDIVYSYASNKMIAGTDFIEFDFDVIDKENLSRVTAIELLDNDGNLVQSLDDLTVRKFENLSLESFYTISTTYKFDLNDGKGEQEEKAVIKYGTSGSKLYITGLQVLNNENPSVGEEVQVSVSLDNPNNLKVTGIFISNQYCPVLNNIAQKEDVIIKFIPETEGGYYTVEVTGYEYESGGIKLQDTLTTEYYEDIIVMGELEIIDYFAVSDTNYESYSSSPMRILEINNPTGYEIRSITYRSDFYEQATNPNSTTTNFEMIDNNHILIKERGNENTNYQNDRDFYDLVLISLTYGIGDVERTLNLPSRHSRISLYSEVVHIKTVDELIGISSGSNVSSEWGSREQSYYKYYILDNDLDLKDERWSGIIAGGVFDGNGHTIKNLRTVINDESTDNQYYGLFKEFRGIIFNLSLENIYISIKTKGTVSVAGISASKGRVYDSNVSGHIDVTAPYGVVTGVSNVLGNLGSWNSIGFAISTNNYVTDLEIVLTKTDGTTDNKGNISSLNGALITDHNSYYYRPDGVLFQPNQIICDVSELSSLAFGNSYLSLDGNVSYPIYVGDTSNAGSLYLSNDLVDHEYHIHTNCDIPDIIETGVAITKVEVQRDGYFLSWYDNEEFTGDPITFPYKSDDKLDLYAKWTRYVEANPNYSYQNYNLWDETNQKNIEGYVISSFGNLDMSKEQTLVVGGYYKGKPVFGILWEYAKSIRTDADGIEHWDYGFDKYTIYYLDTIRPYNVGWDITAKAYYFAGKIVSPRASWNDYPNIYVPEEYEDYYNKCWGFDQNTWDTRYKVKTYTANNNPFDEVCNYAATDEEHAYIKVTLSKADNLVASVKFNSEDLPYEFEYDNENDIKYLNYGDSRFAIINNNVYANVEKIIHDDNFKYIIYKNGDAIIDSVINKRITSINLNDLEYNITKISAEAFRDTNLESIILNEGLVEIGENAFRNTKLTEIKFPTTLRTLGSYAFAYNKQLYSVEMNNNLNRISESAFYECNSLTNLKLPTRLKVVERYAFGYCYNLYNVTLPKGVETLAESSFWVGTLQIYVPITVKNMTTPFDMYNNNTTILTPYASKPAGWKLYYDGNNDNYQIKIVYGVNEVKENDTYEYTLNSKNEVIITRCKDSSITKVEFEFEEGPVVEISSNAFANCPLITEVVLPNTLKVIGNSAFKNISNPLVVEIPDSVETIENNAFNKNAILISTLEEAKEGWTNTLDDQYIFNNTNRYVALIINANIGNNAKVVYETSIDQTPSMNIQDDTIVQGWYFDKAFTQPVQFPFEGTEHITYLYAKTTKNVSLNYSDGMYGYLLASGYAPLVVDEIEITKDDCYSVFYMDRELTEKVTFPLTITEYTNLYVEWKPIKKEKIGNFTYYINSKNEKILIGYKGSDALVDLSTIDGLRRIGNDVFKNNETIQSVIIPEGVVSIGSGAFYRCANLETISLPTTLLTISSEAFYDCDKLSKVILPANVKRVENYAFYNCDKLMTVVLNDGLEYVGNGAFSWINARVIEVPASVTTVGEEAFRTISTGFIIVNSEERPASWSSNFCGQRYNDGRTPKVIYNDGKKYIVLVINYDFDSSATIKYENTIESTPSINTYNNSTISGWYYDQSYTLTVTFPVTGVEHITYLYAKTEKIVTVNKVINGLHNEHARGTVPLTVYEPEYSKEGYYVEGWYKDSGLNVKVEFPYEASDNLTLYPKLVKVVEEDDSTNSFYYYTIGNDIVITNYYGFATDLDLSGMTNLVGIGPSAFADNKTLVSIKLPSTVKSIGSQAFSKCTSLETVELESGLKSIGDKAFYRCGSLVNIEIPDTVTYIGSYAFYECGSIKSIVIPNGVTRLESYTFCYCYSLATITLPDTLTYIGYDAFQGSGLKSIKLPQSLTYIGSYAFAYCNSLAILEIPASVTTIDWCGVRTNNNGVIISNNIDIQPNGWAESYYGQNESEHPTLIYNNVYKWIVLVADNITDSRAYKNNISKTQLESNSLANYKWYTDAEMTQEVTFNENDVFVSNQHITYLYGKAIN